MSRVRISASHFAICEVISECLQKLRSKFLLLSVKMRSQSHIVFNKKSMQVVSCDQQIISDSIKGQALVLSSFVFFFILITSGNGNMFDTSQQSLPSFNFCLQNSTGKQRTCAVHLMSSPQNYFRSRRNLTVITYDATFLSR